MAALFLLIAFISGAISVVLGALAAHAWSGLAPGLAAALQTAVDYHHSHSLLLVLLGLWLQLDARVSGPLLRTAGWLLIVGMLGFSGSLYALALGAPRWLGPITPVGGALLISAWLLLALAAWQRLRRA